MYSQANQTKRSQLKRSKKMRELAAHVWKLVANGKSRMTKVSERGERRGRDASPFPPPPHPPAPTAPKPRTSSR